MALSVQQLSCFHSNFLNHTCFTVMLRKGGWQDVTIPLDRFLQTHKGRLVETRSEMNIHRILSLGISTASLGDTKQDGPFSLGIQSIKATQHKYSPVEN